ncbi:MAG: hypothetical protein JST82_13035 [Bacteroidetes bacterium]|nr:hypothetical protein [Bacteroidota bacterium]
MKPVKTFLIVMVALGILWGNTAKAQSSAATPMQENMATDTSAVKTENIALANNQASLADTIAKKEMPKSKPRKNRNVGQIFVAAGLACVLITAGVFIALYNDLNSD